MADILGTPGNDNIAGTGGDDYINALEGDDFVFGDGGDDFIRGGQGNDTIDGGPEGQFVDTADYGDSPGSVFVDLANGFANDGWGTTDTLIDIEAAFGSAFADTLLGDGGENWFNPSTGDDYVDAGGGFDVLFYEDLGGGGVVVDLQGGWAHELDGVGNVVFTDTVLNFEALHGTYFDDDLYLTDGDGYAFGRAGDDDIFARDGSDSLIGGSGNDYLDGGNGWDQVSFYDDGFDDGTGLVTATQGAVVDMEANTAIDGWGDTDTLANIEGVEGSQFGDVIDGFLSAGDNMRGVGGNDVMRGHGGDDWFQGGSGDDDIDGGDGYDIADYGDNAFNDLQPTQGIVATLGAASTVIDNWGDTDTLTSIERVDGSGMDDVFVADAAFNGTFGAFNEFQGRAGDDSVTGNGETRISYNQSPDGIRANLSDAAATLGGESVAAGTVHDGWGDVDTIYGGVYSVRGSNHDDWILGGDGNEEFRPRGGDDLVDGGAGIDTIRYTSAPGTVEVDLADGMTWDDGWGGVDTLANIENIRGSGSGDTLSGDAGANFIRGEGGNDVLNGRGGDDDIWGGSGNDVIAGGDGVNFMRGNAGDDTITGGSGTGNEIAFGGTGEGPFDFDIAAYDDASGAITANLGAVATVSGAGVGTDTLSQVENVRGSNFADTFNVSADFQSSYDNFADIEGMGGDDVINGNGNTRVAYTKALAAVTVDIAAGTAYGSDGLDTANVGTDTFSGVNWVRGSDFDDTLLGSDGDEIIRGEAGNDLIDGRGGIDRVDYNTIQNGVVVDLAAGTADDGEGGTDTLLNIENVRGTRLDDTLTGDSGVNVLHGNGGNDTLNSGTGNDTVTGDGGNDTFIDAGAVVETQPGGGGDDDDDDHGWCWWRGDDDDRGWWHWSRRGDDDDDRGRGCRRRDDDDDDGGRGRGHRDDDDDRGWGWGRWRDDDDGRGWWKKWWRRDDDDEDEDDDDDNGDIVVVESDDDVYSGGVGDDLFVFGENNGQDTITDFTAGDGTEDVIDVSALNLGSLEELLGLADDQGGTADTTITFSETGSITLVGVQVNELSADDFII